MDASSGSQMCLFGRKTRIRCIKYYYAFQSFMSRPMPITRFVLVNESVP